MRAPRRYGVAERQGAAVDVDDVGVDAEYRRGVDRDAGEGLVYLDEVQVVRAPSGSFERELARVPWNGEQVGRFLGYLACATMEPSGSRPPRRSPRPRARGRRRRL